MDGKNTMNLKFNQRLDMLKQFVIKLNPQEAKHGSAETSLIEHTFCKDFSDSPNGW